LDISGVGENSKSCDEKKRGWGRGSSNDVDWAVEEKTKL